MPRASALKHRAVNLRKAGLSYREINGILGVPKSTLSNWLRSIKLTPKQERRLKVLDRKGLSYASDAHRKMRLDKTQMIFSKAFADIRNVSRNNLWYMGIMLYWAEGHKQSKNNPSRGVMFNNSDPKMIRVFLKWVKDCLKVEEKNIYFEIYIHTTYKKSKSDLCKHWSEITGFSPYKFDKIYFKHNKVRSYRKNRGDDYHGVLRVGIRKSTDLNRQIMGWVSGICEHCGIV